MSRETTVVKHDVAAKALPQIKVPEGYVTLAYGYDKLGFYFLDIMPDCEVGILYGAPFIMSAGTVQVSKGDMYNALLGLGLHEAANMVMLDLPI